MRIVWIWDGSTDDSAHRHNGGESFQKHDDDMKRFRLSHPEIEKPKSREAKAVEFLASIPIREVSLVSNVQN